MGIKRTSEAKWNGSITEGSGNVKLGSGAFEGAYSFNSRFGDDTKATNPEELIAAAHAACYSMALTGFWVVQDFIRHASRQRPLFISKKDDGFVIPNIDLETIAEVPNITDDEFQTIAKTAKEKCPVSQVLAGAVISLSATLK